MNEFLVIEFGLSVKEMKPMVYLVKSDRIRMAKQLAINAVEEWKASDKQVQLYQMIEQKWKLFHIWNHRIGVIRAKLPFNYLAESVERIIL